MASELLTFAIATFTAVFAIVNPLGATTFFVTLTQGYSKPLKLRVIKKAVLAATFTLLVFAFVGNYIFFFFGTSIPAFRIAGGALLFSIGFTMIQGERPRSQLTPQDRQEALEKEVVGVVPLGIPMFAGPGAITTVMVLMAEASNPLDPMAVVVIVPADRPDGRLRALSDHGPDPRRDRRAVRDPRDPGRDRSVLQLTSMGTSRSGERTRDANRVNRSGCSVWTGITARGRILRIISLISRPAMRPLAWN